MRFKSLLLLGALSLFISEPSMAEPMRSTHSLFTFLFMARKATSITQFDERRTDVRVRKNTSPGSLGFVSGTQMEQTGGSTLRKADAVTYEVTSSQDIDSAMGEVLTNAGIEYAAYDDVMINGGGPDPAVIKPEFVHKDDLSAQTRAKIINASRKCDVRYLATWTCSKKMDTSRSHNYWLLIIT